MANRTGIEWTDRTSNPIRVKGGGWGCTKVSPGCAHCYAEMLNLRFGNKRSYKGRWTFEQSAKEIEWLRRFSKPQRVFLCDMTDLFHEDVPDWMIANVFSALERVPGAVKPAFQILTKRPERMLAWVSEWKRKIDYMADSPAPEGGLYMERYGHIWLGVSVEDQQRADERSPLLLQTPAAVRFLSVEPLLGPVDLSKWLDDLVERDGGFPGYRHAPDCEGGCDFGCRSQADPLSDASQDPVFHWVIVGYESGPKARPGHPDWARLLREQCLTAGVPFFFKQWGQWAPHTERLGGGIFLRADGSYGCQGDYWSGSAAAMNRVGKKAAGRLLDGGEWSEFPDPRMLELLQTAL